MQGTGVVHLELCVLYIALDDTLSMEFAEDIPGFVAQNEG